MPRKKKQQPAPAKVKAPASPLPVDVKKQPLPPDAVKRMRKFYEDSYLIERQWRSING